MKEKEAKILPDAVPLPGNNWYAPQYQLPSFHIPTFIELFVKTILFYLHLVGCSVGISTLTLIEFVSPSSPILDYLRPRLEEAFGVVLICCFQFFAPSNLFLYRGEGVEEEELKIKDEYPPKIDMLLGMDKRAVVIANHQLYNDWMVVWSLAYFNKVHGYIKIVLKKSISKVPLFGSKHKKGCVFFKFLFLNRKWEEDKINMYNQLNELNKTPENPLWFLLFPEGTTLCEETRLKSKSFAEKTGQKVFHHLLIPRHLGLYHSVKELSKTVEYLYDYTVGFSGVPAYKSPQYIYTLASMYISGINPKQIHIHVRKFKISEIPLNNEDEFAEWLTKRWEEKDELLDEFYNTGHFPTPQRNGVAEFPTVLNNSVNNLSEILTIWAFSAVIIYLYYLPVKFIWNLVF